MPDITNADSFYKAVLNLLIKSKFPFMVGGGIAVRNYARFITRPTKDLDIFCKGGDYPRIMTSFQTSGFKTSILDERWLSKITLKKYQADLIFSSPNYINSVDDSWFQYATDAKVLGYKVKMIAPEELIWSKAYVQDRTHFDGGDINHILLDKGAKLDWKRLLMRMESHWDLLLSLLLNFRFVYPSERGLVPKWLMEELIDRLGHQLQNPIPRDKICRGPLLSRTQYVADIEEGGFKSIS